MKDRDFVKRFGRAALRRRRTGDPPEQESLICWLCHRRMTTAGRNVCAPCLHAVQNPAPWSHALQDCDAYEASRRRGQMWTIPDQDDSLDDQCSVFRSADGQDWPRTQGWRRKRIWDTSRIRQGLLDDGFGFCRRCDTLTRLDDRHRCEDGMLITMASQAPDDVDALDVDALRGLRWHYPAPLAGAVRLPSAILSQ